MRTVGESRIKGGQHRLEIEREREREGERGRGRERPMETHSM
jgi:hypothetical protein